MAELMLGRPDDTIWQLAADRPKAPFIIGPDGESLNYGAFVAHATTRRKQLAAAGVTAGSRVVFLCRNSTDFLLSCFGAWRLNALVVPINLQQRGVTLGHLLDIADPTLIVVDQLGAIALETASDRPTAPLVTLKSLTGAPELSISDSQRDLGDAAAPAMILFSSGTTGVPKGCLLSHEYLAWCGETFWTVGDLCSQDRVYSCNQLCHINAWWAFLSAVVGGIPFALDVAFSASQFWARVTATQATAFDYVGVQIPILLKATDTSLGLQSSLRVGIGGGTGPAAIQLFTERSGVRLLEGYGLTECCVPIFQRESEFRLGTMGKSSDWVDVRLVGEAGGAVSPGTAGELLLRPKSPRTIFSGYWRRDDLTKAAFDGEWFKTGDICRADQDGYFSFVGRRSHVIRTR